MNPNELRDLSEGDTVRVNYESVYGERGNEQAFEATVVAVDVDEWPTSDATDVDLYLYEGDADDERDDRYVYEGEANRRVEVLFYDDDHGVDLIHADVQTRNGYRWSRLNRVGHDAEVEVDADDEPREAVTMWQAWNSDEGRDVRTRLAYDDDYRLDLPTFARAFEPVETLLDTTDLDEAFRAFQGETVNLEQRATHMVPSASTGDVFEVHHSDGTSTFHVVARFGFDECGFTFESEACEVAA